MKRGQTISRTELYRLVWAEPLTILAKRFGISDVGLRKICQRHDIPLPPVGYRQRLKAGQAAPSARLPRPNEQVTIEFPAPAILPDPDELLAVYTPLIEGESHADRQIDPPSEGEIHHPVAKRVLNALKASTPDMYGAVVYDGPEPFRVRVPPSSIPRAARLIDAFARVCDLRGLEIRAAAGPETRSGIMIVGEAERLAIEEASQKKVHWSTEAEKARTRRLGYSTAPMYDYVPSGVMTVQIATATYRNGVRSVWKDGKTRRVEDCLNEIMVGLYRSSHAAAVQRRKHEARERRADDENVRRARLREEKRAAQQQLEQLESQADAWSRAQRLRAFISAYEAANGGRDGGASEWIEQALQHADRIDPLTPTPASAIDYADAELRPVSPWQIADD